LPCLRFKIDLSGSGSGTVVTTDQQWFNVDGLILCVLGGGVLTDYSVCSHDYQYNPIDFEGVPVYFTAEPEPGNEVCVAGQCYTGGQKLRQLMTADTTVAISFHPLSYDLSVQRGGTGSGKVVSDPPYIDCGESCEASFDFGTPLTLVATPDTGSIFKEWRGYCEGETGPCFVGMYQDVTITAVFALKPAPTPTKPRVTAMPTTAPASASPTATAPVATSTAVATTTIPASTGSSTPVPSSSPTEAVAVPSPSATASPGDVPETPVATSSGNPAAILLVVLLAGALVALGTTVVLLMRRRPG
jgi:hypothetical protein